MTAFVVYDKVSGTITQKGNVPFSSLQSISANIASTSAMSTIPDNTVVPQYARIDPTSLVITAIDPPAPSQAQLLSALADVRYTYETKGVIIDSHNVPTDRDSQNTYIALFVVIFATILSKIPWLYTPGLEIPNFIAVITTIQTSLGSMIIPWKYEGSYHDISAITSIQLGLTVLNYVQGCRAVERTAQEAILAGTIKTKDDLNSISWPARVFYTGLLANVP